MDANGLDPEQQALLASIMGKSPQVGGGAAFTAAKVTPAAPVGAPGGASGSVASAASPASIPADPGRLLSQAEIDALIASMV